MGGITSSAIVVTGAGLSGNGTPANPLTSTAITYGGIGSHVSGICVFPANTALNTTTVTGSSIGYANEGTVNFIASHGMGVDLTAVDYLKGYGSPVNSYGLSGTWRLVSRVRNSGATTFGIGGLFVRIA
jgi:hypothetical protein